MSRADEQRTPRADAQRNIDALLAAAEKEFATLGAVAKLCIPARGTNDTSRADQMIPILIDGMRYGAHPAPDPPAT